MEVGQLAARKTLASKTKWQVCGLRSKEQETDLDSLIHTTPLALRLNNIHVASRVARLQRQALGVGVEAHDRLGRPRG